MTQSRHLNHAPRGGRLADVAAPCRHPSDALLFADGAGALSPALSLVLETHRAFCPICRQAAAAATATGGALLEDVSPVAMSGGALERALAALPQNSNPALPQNLSPASPQSINPSSVLNPDPALPPAWPQALAPFAQTVAAGDWRRLGWGIKMLTLAPRGAYGGGAHLVRMSPGAWMPRHGHDGLELTVVLSGTFADEHGRYAPGDFIEADGELDHQPIADANEDCVCLVAMDGVLRFDGFFRLLAPFVKL